MDAWSVDPHNFPYQLSRAEKLKFLLRFAILSPSGHNTQPWLFSLGENEILLFANKKKQLRVLDPSGRNLYVSLGACLANLEAAAMAFNLEFETMRFPEAGNRDYVAKIFFRNLHSAYLKDEKVLESLLWRRNNRESYKSEALPEGLVSELKSLVHDPSLRFDLVFDWPRKKELASLSSAGIKMAFENPDFRSELSSYLRNNLSKEADGLPIYTTDVPLSSNTLASFIIPTIIAKFNIGALKAKKDYQKLITSPAIGVFGSKEDNEAAWFKVGENFERAVLKAASYRVSSAVIAAAIEEGELYKDVQKVLETDFRPQMLFRMGLARKESRHSPRISVEELLV